MGGGKKEDELGAFFNRGSPEDAPKKEKQCRGRCPNIVVSLKVTANVAVSFGEICVRNFLIYCASKTTFLRPRTPFAVRLLQER